MQNSRHPVRSFGVTFPKGHPGPSRQTVPPVAAGWHQLIHATRGVMSIRTGDCAWVVPPQRAMWIPAGERCEVRLSGEVALRTLYLLDELAVGLPSRTMAVNVSPLLRELIVRVNRIGALDREVPEQDRLIGVILDELKLLREAPLPLPLPKDPRALRLAALAQEEESLPRLVRECGASLRTLERLFRAETHMSLGQWRRRQKLQKAIGLLGSGEPVNAVALDLGYGSASAFIAMFQRELGETPARYFRLS
jgi:AraC-like DNA-binding protein